MFQGPLLVPVEPDPTEPTVYFHFWHWRIHHKPTLVPACRPQVYGLTHSYRLILYADKMCCWHLTVHKKPQECRGRFYSFVFSRSAPIININNQPTHFYVKKKKKMTSPTPKMKYGENLWCWIPSKHLCLLKTDSQPTDYAWSWGYHRNSLAQSTLSVLVVQSCAA